MGRFQLQWVTPGIVALGLLAVLQGRAAGAEEKAPSGQSSLGAAAKPGEAKGAAEAPAGAAGKGSDVKSNSGCAEMKAALAKENAELEGKLAAVDAASGEAKLAAMSALLHALVSQHTAMHGAQGECTKACAAMAGMAAEKKMAMGGCEMMGSHDGSGAHAGGHGAHGKGEGADHESHH